MQKCRSCFTKPYQSPLDWFPVFVTCIVCFGLYICRYYFSATLIALILLGTIALVIYDNNLRRLEIHRKIKNILDDIHLARSLCKDWTVDNYPNLCSPLSPCVTLQWTYRDGHIVNLPWALLVHGDYIILRPGQVAPGLCAEITGKHTFKCGETYGLPHVSDNTDALFWGSGYFLTSFPITVV